jgi:predicted TPR repeat methyltransferase
MLGVEYSEPERCAEVVCKYFPENREHVVVFDVGTGTGLAAEEVCYIYIILVKIYMKLIL